MQTSLRPLPCRFPLRAALLVLTVGIAPAIATADDKTGEQLYRQQCARCHGINGEGSKKYEQALVGEKSVAQLAKLIRQTMPEDKPGTLSEADAAKLATFIHEAFYSPAAQARNKPARVELSRLTVRQYQNAIADLVGSFRPAPKWDETKRGLRGEYYNARNFRGNARLIDRLDPEVKFDFGTVGPQVEKGDKFDPHQFSIRWEGSVLAPETGTYEFVVRTEHATRLWVNENRKPLIDAWVKSGNDTEYRTSIYLIAGRAYPIRLEFSKAKQGVDDSKKNPNPPPKKASVALEWKPPHGGLGVIPARNLSPQSFPESFVVTTPFPPDDRSLGWERANTVSKAWDAAATDAALDAAAYVAAHIDELSGVRAPERNRGPGSGNPADIRFDAPPAAKPTPERDRKIREFCRTFAEHAFRRPLTDEQARVFVDRQFESAADPEVAVKRVVLFVLKSPRFLYREVGGGPDAYDTAARLSFALWDSIPDAELLTAAAKGELATREQVARHAERMLADPRAKMKLHEFLMTWLKVEQPPDLAKDAKRFPGFDAALAADLRASLELFLDDVLWSEDGDFRKLLLADELALNGRLAKFYGVKLPAPPPVRGWFGEYTPEPADASFRNMKLNPDQRAGVLTHPYLMSAFAYTSETSPIHRGVFIARGVLGLAMRPPPEAFTPLPAELHPNLSTRERVALQTKPAACISCHGVINPLGFTLEHFDAVGRYREKDAGKPVADDGSYQTRKGQVVKFDGVRALAKFLAASDEVHAAFAEQLFHHLVKQPVRAYGANKLAELRDSFSRGGFNIRKLAVEAAVTAALPVSEVKPPGR
jgi:cytochrome c553